MNELFAISPVDGRYRKTTAALADFFSEYALIRYRTFVEAEYFIALVSALPRQFDGIPAGFAERLRERIGAFSEEDARQIKDIEKTTNHDVKAVEYFLRKYFESSGWENYREWIHFGLTSQDINNTALPMMIRDALQEVIMPAVFRVMDDIRLCADTWKDQAMLAHTHGQPASPTRLGKEFRVFAERLQVQTDALEAIPFTCKFGGATGNFNAHVVAFPDVNWPAFADVFCARHLGMMRQQTTTQIEHYDQLAALFDGMKRINTILIDFCRDMWTYISMDYFKQKIREGEVGSSAMPHKVNPIDFENAEGNLGIANALLEHLAAKLPVSRLQRDLTDSTATRNIGVPFAHTLIACQSVLRGISKLLLNKPALDADLEKNWVVVAEAIQTILRREGYPDPYNALKELTRTNGCIGKKQLHEFIDKLEVDEKVRKEMKKISPENYTGIA